MARQRIRAAELAHTLNAAPQPLYVLDDEWTIVFCNQACCAWLGAAADRLLGRRCLYHSGDPSAEDALAAGLCPPPAAMAGREMTATVSCPAAAGTSGGAPARYRRARFIPLRAGPEDLLGLVAILDSEDLPEPAEAADTAPLLADEAPPVALHEQIRRFRRQAAAQHRADRLIGNSPAMRRARAQIDLAAASRSSALLVGPPGSGKQRAAAAIHYGHKSQTPGSLIPLACAVLGADLIRSTVAALASGNPLGDDTARSTLLLNDADQIPLEVHGSLASALGSRSFPLRIIATAARSLAKLVHRGKYREDLAGVLSTLTIELPPLARRREDLPLLAQLLLEETNAQGGKQLGGLSPEALDALDGYAWPGNIDELAQVVAEAHRKAAGPEIAVEDLPPRIHLAAEAAACPRPPTETIVLDEFLARVERELLQRALAQTKGNKAKAARLLGISRPRLLRRIEQLGLNEPR